MCPPRDSSFAAELTQLKRERPLKKGEILTKLQTHETTSASIVIVLGLHLSFRRKLKMKDLAEGVHGLTVLAWGRLSPPGPTGCYGEGKAPWIWVIYTRDTQHAPHSLILGHCAGNMPASE